MDLIKIILLVIVFINVACIILFFYGKSFLKKLIEDKEKINSEINELKNKKEAIIQEYYEQSTNEFLEDYKIKLETYNKIIDETEDFDIGLKKDFDFKFEHSTLYKQKLADLDK